MSLVIVFLLLRADPALEATLPEGAAFGVGRPRDVDGARDLCPSAPRQRDHAHRAVKPGDAMAFDMLLRPRFMEGEARIGDVRIAAGQPRLVDGAIAIPVRAEAKSVGFAGVLARFDARMVTFLDARTWESLRFANRLVDVESFAGEPNDSREVVAFAHGALAGRYERSGDDARRVRVWRKIGSDVTDVTDVLGVLTYVRSRDLGDGEPVCFVVYNRMQLWRVSGRVTGREVVATTAVARRAVRFEATAEEVGEHAAPHTFTLWLSDDDDRLPLRITSPLALAEISVELVDYEP